MEKGANGAAAAVAERDMQVTIPAAEYRALVLAEAKLEGLRNLYELDDGTFKRLAGWILGILEDEE